MGTEKAKRGVRLERDIPHIRLVTSAGREGQIWFEFRDLLAERQLTFGPLDRDLHVDEAR